MGTGSRSIASPGRILAIALALSLPSAGCATYRIYQADDVTHGSPRPGQNTPSTLRQERVLHSVLWGFYPQDYPIVDCQDETGRTWGIEEVHVERNALFFLASTVTLGFWSPIEVSYRCAKPCPPQP